MANAPTHESLNAEVALPTNTESLKKRMSRMVSDIGRHEVLLLVGVVDVGQPVLDRPDPEHEGAEQDPAERRPAGHAQPARPAAHRRTPAAFPVVGVPVPFGTGP